MEYVYAALVLNSAGKDITEQGVTAVLQAAGVSPETGRVKALVAALEGADIAAAIENATKAPIAVAGAAPAAAAPAEEKEEEKEEPGVSEEEAAAGLGALFG